MVCASFLVPPSLFIKGGLISVNKTLSIEISPKNHLWLLPSAFDYIPLTCSERHEIPKTRGIRMFRHQPFVPVPREEVSIIGLPADRKSPLSVLVLSPHWAIYSWCLKHVFPISRHLVFLSACQAILLTSEKSADLD
ncbi:unnamed protein product [Rodentolepis nana]|uniref:Uncharacterized protein n=1 Tax=Rodentolepis nana TaxID=102285 RepID=A0A0R3TFT9_RODNA|nr:unnamed protein product [Rodentolepis nana]